MPEDPSTGGGAASEQRGRVLHELAQYVAVPSYDLVSRPQRNPVARTIANELGWTGVVHHDRN